MTVNSMQEKLQKHGIPSSPFAKYVLTQYAATRDVSMAAQAKEEFSKLSPVTQAKLKTSARDLVIKAEALKEEFDGDQVKRVWGRTLDGPLAETELPSNDAANQGKVNKMAGVTNPMGFFDPWGFSTKASKGRLLFYREAELKHGRVCMLATLGIIVGEKYHPLYGGNIDVPSYMTLQETSLQAFWVGAFVCLGLLELLSLQSFSWKGTDWTVDPDWTPVEWDPLQIASKMPKSELFELQNKELNNGRLAMFAAAGIIAQEYVTGKKIF
jgi:hypothetical protein